MENKIKLSKRLRDASNLMAQANKIFDEVYWELRKTEKAEEVKNGFHN